MLSAAASAIEPTVIEWLYVLGARRTSSCSSGWATSPSSSRLKSVSTPKRCSMKGSSPVVMKPAATAHSAVAQGVAAAAASSIGWSSIMPMATYEQHGHGAGEQSDVDQLAAAADASQVEHGGGGHAHQQDELATARVRWPARRSCATTPASSRASSCR